MVQPTTRVSALGEVFLAGGATRFNGVPKACPLMAEFGSSQIMSYANLISSPESNIFRYVQYSNDASLFIWHCTELAQAEAFFKDASQRELDTMGTLDVLLKSRIQYF